MVLIKKILLGLALLYHLRLVAAFAPILPGETKIITTSLHTSKESIKPSESSQHEWYSDGTGWATWHASGAVDHDSTQKDDWVAEAFKSHTPTGTDTMAIPKETKDSLKWYTDFGWMEHAGSADPDRVLSVEKNKERPGSGSGLPASMYSYTPPDDSRIRAPLKKNDSHEWFMGAMDDFIPSKVMPLTGSAVLDDDTMMHHELFTDGLENFSPDKNPTTIGSDGDTSKAEWFTSALADFTPTPRPLEQKQGLKGTDWFTVAMGDFMPPEVVVDRSVDKYHHHEWFSEALHNFVQEKKPQAQEWFSGALANFVPKKIAVAPELLGQAIKGDLFQDSIMKDFTKPAGMMMKPTARLNDKHDQEWFTEALHNIDPDAPKLEVAPPLDKKALERHKWMEKHMFIPVYKSKGGLKQYVFSKDEELKDSFVADAGAAGP